MRKYLTIPAHLKAQLVECGINPIDLVLYINSTCNLRCKHCYIGDDLLNRSEAYDTNDINRFLNEFQRLDRVTILGGEPLLHPGINSIIDNIAQNNVGEVRVTTNLNLLNVFDYKRHSAKNLVVCVSIDGHIADSHDLVRGEGAFEATIHNIELLLQEGYDIEITHTVMKHNIDDFFYFIEFCKSLGIKKLNLHKISPMGNALENSELSISPSRWISLCREIEKQSLDIRSEAAPLRLRYPLLYVSTDEYEDLLRQGKYHHHYQRSFYADKEGHRVVLYPDKKLYVSSEAFGTDLFIGDIEDGSFHYNESEQNEIHLFRRLHDSAMQMMSRQFGNAENRYIPLSLSFRRTCFI